MLALSNDTITDCRRFKRADVYSSVDRMHFYIIVKGKYNKNAGIITVTNYEPLKWTNRNINDQKKKKTRNATEYQMTRLRYKGLRLKSRSRN